MKIRINITPDELAKIQAIRKQKAEAEAEAERIMLEAMENAIPWEVGLDDADVAAYRAARAEAKRLAEKYGEISVESLISKLESLNAELESVIKNRDEIQQEKQQLKKKIADLESKNLLLKGLLRDTCGSICGNGYDPKLAEQEQAAAAFEKLTEVKSIIAKLNKLVQ